MEAVNLCTVGRLSDLLPASGREKIAQAPIWDLCAEERISGVYTIEFDIKRLETWIEKVVSLLTYQRNNAPNIPTAQSQRILVAHQLKFHNKVIFELYPLVYTLHEPKKLIST